MRDLPSPLATRHSVGRGLRRVSLQFSSKLNCAFCREAETNTGLGAREGDCRALEGPDLTREEAGGETQTLATSRGGR